jgi:hypothetical protein
VTLTVTASAWGAYSPVSETVSGEVGFPTIERIRGHREPGTLLNILGKNFGHGSEGSTVHIASKQYDPGHPRVKLWTDTKIRIKLPYKNNGCDWFKQGVAPDNYRKRKLWVTVQGVDSNIKKLKVRPATGTCP